MLNHIFDSTHRTRVRLKATAMVRCSTDSGTVVAYALFNLQDRGEMFVAPQTPVYQGMIVGEHKPESGSLEINVLKGKQLTNVRASGSDEAVKLVPPRRMSLGRK